MRQHSGVTKEVCAASFDGLSSGNVVLRRPRAREKNKLFIYCHKIGCGGWGCTLTTEKLSLHQRVFIRIAIYTLVWISWYPVGVGFFFLLHYVTWNIFFFFLVWHRHILWRKKTLDSSKCSSNFSSYKNARTASKTCIKF